MWGKEQNVFCLYTRPLLLVVPLSPPCVHVNAFRILVHLVGWNADLRRDVSRPAEVFICIWNSKLQKNKPEAESTPILWQLLPCRALSLDSGEDEARCQRGSPRQKHSVQRYDVQKSSDWARGWHFVKRTCIPPFWLDIKMLFKSCAHYLTLCYKVFI